MPTIQFQAGTVPKEGLLWPLWQSTVTALAMTCHASCIIMSHLLDMMQLGEQQC